MEKSVTLNKAEGFWHRFARDFGDVPSTPSDINAVNWIGETPLIVAVKNCALGKVVTLLQHDADVHAVDSSGRTALYHDMIEEEEDIVRVLVRNSTWLDKEDRGANVLRLAVEKGLSDIIPTLSRKVTASALNQTNQCGENLFLIAVQMENMRVVRALLSTPICCTDTDKMGRNALHLAAERDLPQMVSPLAKKLNINLPDIYGRTPLCIAAASDSADTFAELLRRGAKPDIRDLRGNTIFHAAASNGGVDVLFSMPHFFEEGINEVVNNDGETPLHAACAFACDAAVDFLLELAKVKEPLDHKRRTPLMHALMKGNFDTAMSLLAAMDLIACAEGIRRVRYNVSRSELIERISKHEIPINLKVLDDDIASA